MRKKVEQKKEYYLFDQNPMHGTLKIKGQNYGTYTTLINIKMKALEFFQYLIGQKLIFGSTYIKNLFL